MPRSQRPNLARLSRGQFKPVSNVKASGRSVAWSMISSSGRTDQSRLEAAGCSAGCIFALVGFAKSEKKKAGGTEKRVGWKIGCQLQTVIGGSERERRVLSKFDRFGTIRTCDETAQITGPMSKDTSLDTEPALSYWFRGQKNRASQFTDKTKEYVN